MDKQEKKGLAIGAVIGAVVGVVTGILFAPKSGEETRKDIKEVSVKAAHKLQDDAEKVQEEVKQLITKVEAKAKSSKGATSEAAKKHATEAKKQAKNVVSIMSAVKAGKADDKDLSSAIKQLKGVRTSMKSFLSK